MKEMMESICSTYHRRAPSTSNRGEKRAEGLTRRHHEGSPPGHQRVHHKGTKTPREDRTVSVRITPMAADPAGGPKPFTCPDLRPSASSTEGRLPVLPWCLCAFVV